LPVWDSPPGESPSLTRTGPGGQTFWNGRIDQAQTWSPGDQTTLVGKVIFTAGLTIEAGATVEAVDDALIAKGPLTATGTSDQPITFTSNASTKQPGQWDGVVLDAAQADRIEHWRVRYARQALAVKNIQPASPLPMESIQVDSVSGTGVMLNQARVSATDWSIADAGGSGVTVKDGSQKTTLQSPTIKEVEGNGLSVKNAEVEVTSGRIENVGNRGISLNGGGATATVDGIVVEQNGEKVRSGGCVFVQNGAALTLTGSELKRCSVGLDLTQKDDYDNPQVVTATGNTITENQRGVRVNPNRNCCNRSGGKYPSVLEVRENQITGNVDSAVEIRDGQEARQTELDFTNNWWGTTDGVNVAERIRDQSDDGGSAFVEFLPVWDSPPGESPSLTRTGPDGHTFWNGRISETQSWRRANGPHVVVGALVVNPQKSLTIEQGTEVQFLKNGLDAQGNLVVQGSEEDRVQMQLHESTPVDRWPGIRIRGGSARSSRLLYATLEQVRTGVSVESIPQVGPESYPELEGLFIKESNRGVSISNSRVDLRRSRIVNFDSEGIRATGADTNLQIFDNSTVAQKGQRTRSGTCVAVRNRATVTVQTSIIATCNRGINVHSQGGNVPDVEVTGSVVTRHSAGVRIAPNGGGDDYPDIVASSNDLLGNGDWNVRVEEGNNPGETTLDFTQNWWGTTTAADIDAKIRDADDNENLASVDFTNKLTEENGTYGLADINSDGQTDGFDLSLLASAFGTLQGEEDYNPDANLNSDDRIDGFDLSLLGTRFGQLGATDLKSLRKEGAQLLAASGRGAPVDYASRPDSALKKTPTRLRVVADAGPFAKGDTIAYQLRVEDTPSLFGLSAQLRYQDGKMRFADGRAGPFLAGPEEDPVVGLADATQGQGTVGMTRTRAHRRDSPSGSGRVATLRFVTRTPIEEAPPLSLSGVGLIAPDGRTAYDTGVEGTVGPPREATAPDEYRLRGNYPNPFSQSTTLSFSLPERETVTIEVYDTMGRHVRTVVDRNMEAGTHTLQFDGRGLSSGIYFCRLQTQEKMLTTRLSVVR